MSASERLVALSRAAAERGTRGLFVVEAPPGAPGSAGAERLPDRADRIAGRLGTENPRLVHDARQRLDPALLAAEAGTVPAGGVLTLLVPPLERCNDAAPRSPFARRFARLLLEHVAAEPATSARLSLTADEAAAFAVAAESRARAAHRPHRPDEGDGSRERPIVPSPVATAGALAAQDALLERALAHLGAGARPLVVVEAPRGHGKSALLGRLAAALARAGDTPSLCAARRSAIEVLERHFVAGAGGARGAAAPPFLPPDAALARDGDTLLVDEAASLPLPLLERLLGRWRRVVLATTSAGYESGGRAFALRLPETLDRERPGWLRLAPPEPMRWRADDPLDALVARVTLAGAALAVPSATALADAKAAAATRVDRDTLARDEGRLRAIFGLLAATHYQSTPLDLTHLLDGDDVALWTIERDGAALGAALVAIEPGIAPALHADVLARRRRLPHRLLPQLLAQSADTAIALDATYARVVRVSVHPAARRRGFGRRLLAAIVRDTRDEVEAVGASFGETAATRAFWNACGFDVFHRGQRHNPRSGRRSVAVLRAASARTRAALAVASAIHRDNAAAEGRIADDVPAGAPAVTSGHAPTEPATPATSEAVSRARDRALLRRFANGERSLSDTRAALRRLVRTAIAERCASGTASAGDARHPDAGASVSSAPDEAARLLGALGLDVPPARRRREARLREWVRDRAL